MHEEGKINPYIVIGQFRFELALEFIQHSNNVNQLLAYIYKRV